ncbi:polyprenyl-pyrophosphate binding protein [Thiocapsa sp. KS1]|nr:polyprenyl-pyrophosphate binding protein [Thiocapsa sp. KS1]
MKTMKIKMLPVAIWCLAVVSAIPAVATAAVERYVIDTEGGHAFVQFRIKHLAYSWLYGRFNDFSGTFTYDTEDTSNSKVEVTIDTASLDSNHAERDKHLRGKDFLDVDRYPQASFKSMAYKETGFNTSVLEGELTLKGITKPVRIEVQRIGNGPDPWGGYRRGFQGSTSFALKDFGIDYNLGPAAREVEMILSIEGVRQ